MSSESTHFPWHIWLQLPQAWQDFAAGRTRPTPCRVCGGTGCSPEHLRATAVEKRLGGEVVCLECMDGGWIHVDGPFPHVAKCRSCERVETDQEAKRIHAIVCDCGRQ